MANAEHGELCHKVSIELEGIPLHVWNSTTAADLIRPYCLLESVDQDTLDRRDLSVFRLTARTTRPELIPGRRTLVVPEPAGADAPFQLTRRTLKYAVKITVRRLLVRLPPDSPPDSPPPDSPSETSTDEESPPANPKRRRRTRGRRRDNHRQATPSVAVDGSASVERRRAPVIRQPGGQRVVRHSNAPVNSNPGGPGGQQQHGAGANLEGCGTGQ